MKGEIESSVTNLRATNSIW